MCFLLSRCFLYIYHQAVAATLLFISGFSLGQGAVCWILLTEIVPSRIRAQAFSIFTAVNWLSNLFIGLFTLSAINAMGEWLLPASSGGDSGSGGGGGGGDGGDDGSSSLKDQQKAGVAGLYAVFCVLSVLAVVFIYVFVRETMGKSLEELEEGGSDGGGENLAFGRRGVEDEDDGAAIRLLQQSEHGGGGISVGGSGGGSGGDGEETHRIML